MSENTVLRSATFDPRQFNEALAAAAITPGDLVELTSAATDTMQRHSAASGLNQRFFAVENIGIAGDLDTDYAVNETGRYVMALPGDEVYAWLANAVAVTKETSYLVSNGDGSLKLATTEIGNELVAIARQTVTATGKTRVMIRVL